MLVLVSPLLPHSLRPGLVSSGMKVGSCDADGVVKLWDARMVAEIGTMEAGQHPLNSVCFDRSATRMAAASNDGTVKVMIAIVFFMGREIHGCVGLAPIRLQIGHDDYLLICMC